MSVYIAFGFGRWLESKNREQSQSFHNMCQKAESGQHICCVTAWYMGILILLLGPKIAAKLECSPLAYARTLVAHAIPDE